MSDMPTISPRANGRHFRRNRLYIWEIESSGKQNVNVTYDNAITIEADLLHAVSSGR